MPMGEVRLLRNLIVHKNAVVPKGFSAPFLSWIWGGIGTGALVITDKVIHALIEQLNAIRIEVADHSRTAETDAGYATEARQTI